MVYDEGLAQRMRDDLGEYGTAPMRMGDRTMSGYVVLGEAAMADDQRRKTLLRMALDLVEGMPSN